MKQIEVILSRSHMSDAIATLDGLGIHFTHYESKGHGRTPATRVEIHRGTETITEEFNVNLTVMAVVPDSMVNTVVDKILNNMAGSEGKIFVYDVLDAIDLRTKKHGDSIL